jgi:predicted nucleotidyltransferase
MAQIPTDITHALHDYVQHVAQDIRVTSAVVFGSYAKGHWRDDSDIDIAIFSEDFAGMDRVDAITFLLNKALPYHLDIQPLAYDAADLLNEQENPFLHEILTTGIKVA